MSSIEDTFRRIVHEEVGALRTQISEMVARLPERRAPASIDTLDVAQIAQKCHVKPKTVRGWIEAKRLCATKPGRKWVVTTKELERFLSQPDSAPEPDMDAQVARVLRLGRTSNG